jgi:hypothetical protein
MPTRKKSTVPATKPKKPVTKRSTRTTLKRKPMVTLIDGVEVTLLPPVGKGSLKLAAIRKAVKKVVKNRVRYKDQDTFDSSVADGVKKVMTNRVQ